MQAIWQKLEIAFFNQFFLVVQKEMAHTRFFNLIFNFKQRGQSIIEYIKEEDQLNVEFPIKF